MKIKIIAELRTGGALSSPVVKTMQIAKYAPDPNPVAMKFIGRLPAWGGGESVGGRRRLRRLLGSSGSSAISVLKLLSLNAYLPRDSATLKDYGGSRGGSAPAAVCI